MLNFLSNKKVQKEEKCSCSSKIKPFSEKNENHSYHTLFPLTAMLDGGLLGILWL